MEDYKEYPTTQDEVRKHADYQNWVEFSSNTWWDDVPEGMAPHEIDYDASE